MHICDSDYFNPYVFISNTVNAVIIDNQTKNLPKNKRELVFPLLFFFVIHILFFLFFRVESVQFFLLKEKKKGSVNINFQTKLQFNMKSSYKITIILQPQIRIKKKQTNTQTLTHSQRGWAPYTHCMHTLTKGMAPHTLYIQCVWGLTLCKSVWLQYC